MLTHTFSFPARKSAGQESPGRRCEAWWGYTAWLCFSSLIFAGLFSRFWSFKNQRKRRNNADCVWNAGLCWYDEYVYKPVILRTFLVFFKLRKFSWERLTESLWTCGLLESSATFCETMQRHLSKGLLFQTDFFLGFADSSHFIAIRVTLKCTRAS